MTWLGQDPGSDSLGRKYDGGKIRWDLLPMGALTEVAKVLTYGARKYADDNWRHVRPLRRRYSRAGIGHVFSWLAGERDDPETGYHHLAHAVCCLVFILDVEVEGGVPLPFIIDEEDAEYENE